MTSFNGQATTYNTPNLTHNHSGHNLPERRQTIGQSYDVAQTTRHGGIETLTWNGERDAVSLRASIRMIQLGKLQMQHALDGWRPGGRRQRSGRQPVPSPARAARSPMQPQQRAAAPSACLRLPSGRSGDRVLVEG